MEYNYPFTYDFYRELIKVLKEEGYIFTTYCNSDMYMKNVIMRHDIDNSIEKALTLAKLENKEGVISTYFVLVSSPFYNIFNKENIDKLKQIKGLGHDIGLHFDEMNYIPNDNLAINELILKEVTLLEQALDIDVKAVSMHRPSKKTLISNYDLGSIVNSYGEKFFKEYKYISDSRRRWREDVIQIIRSGVHDKLHILTHAFWYNNNEKSMRKSIRDYIVSSKYERYDAYHDNFTNLDEVIRRDEI